jgi:hypothetical protein
MKARNINRADRMENISRSGHAGAMAAPNSDAINIRNVEPTTHQLVFSDSTPKGKVALKRSLSDRASDVVARIASSICRTSHVTFYSRALCTGGATNIIQFAPIATLDGTSD